VLKYPAANNMTLVFIFLFVFIGVVITTSGSISIVKSTTRTFGDDNGSKVSPDPFSNKMKPRVIPHQSSRLTGDSAKTIGYIYLFLGITILLTVFFFYIKIGFVFIG